MGSNVCYACGKEGHFARSCPNQGRGEGQMDVKPRANARVYALSEGEVEAGPSTVVTGQLPIANILAYTLIDSGASHSFLARKLIGKLEWKVEKFSQPFITITPAGETYESQFWYRNVPITINGQVLYANLIAIEMSDYDAILGMDWLSAHCAVIDCQKKSVVFRTPEGEKFEYKGTSRQRMFPMISALKAQRMLKSGCLGYVAHIIDTTAERQVEPQEVPVVREYLSVFPEELPGLPPDREIEFEIELIPRTAPISKAPYRMVPVELKELKTQLQ